MRAAVAASLIGAAAAGHYEDPKKDGSGCQTTEVDIQIQGVKGSVCAPACTGMTCPTDPPTGVTAKPQCALQDASSGKKYCALICTPGADDAQCGTNASCKSIQGVGICTYDDDSKLTASREVAYVPATRPRNYWLMFKNWQQEFGKYYNGDEMPRFEIFKTNVDLIDKTNAQGLGYTLGLNQFADMSSKEVVEQYTGYKAPNATKWDSLPYLGRHTYSGKALDDAVDWTTKGAVTPVKNQGSCGSCWAFSTTGAIEGAWKIANGTLASISEQQYVDCDKVDQGCNGGLMDNGFKFAEANGLCTEESYAYTGRKGTSCKASSCTVGIPSGSITGYKDVDQSSMQALMEAVTQQPVSIAIEADKSVFQLYKSGVLSGMCGSTLDHGVLLVGYGTDNGQQYWKVKNSWGSTWGQQGYVNLLRGKGGTGECGLLSQPSYPVMKSSADVSTPMTSHYEDPAKGGCQQGELSIQVQGVKGDFCAPECTSTPCPTDVPKGVTAKPQCVLQNAATGKKYCALICAPSSEFSFVIDSQCGTDASCKSIQGTGLCTYDDTAKLGQEVMFAPANEVVV